MKALLIPTLVLLLSGCYSSGAYVSGGYIGATSTCYDTYTIHIRITQIQSQ